MMRALQIRPSSPWSPGPVRVCACAGATALMIGGTDALALDLSSEPNIVTDTPASLERQRSFDRSRTYGAERVSDRAHSPGAPEGLRLGSLFIFPALDTSAQYDDNLYASHFNRVSDTRFEVAPALRFETRLPRHVLNLRAGAKSVSYLENSDQDYVNIHGLAAGALHLDSGHTLSAAAASSLEHEERQEITSPDSAIEPSEFTRTQVTTGLTRDIGRLFTTISAGATWLDYGSVLLNDGSLFNQDVRDQQILSARIRTGYRISPGFEAITKLEVIRSDNDGTGNDDRSSTGWEAVAGLRMESSPLLRWQLIGGYGVRDFDREEIENVRSLLLEGRVEWLATQRLTLRGEISHGIVGDLGSVDAGRIATEVSAAADYEIYHNTVARAGLAYREAELIGADRTDTIYEANAGLDYYATPNWLLSFDYTFQDRQSTDIDYEMTRNVFRVGAKYRY